MKTIIAGGRNTLLTKKDCERLDELPITIVISGGARGVDADGETYAKNKNLPVRVFPADWRRLGNSAGPIRNRQMAQYADAVVLFPGGRGTDSMLREAIKAKLKIWDFR